MLNNSEGDIKVFYADGSLCALITFFEGGITALDESGDVDIYYDEEDCTALYAWLGY
jgi:hypothetical protein